MLNDTLPLKRIALLYFSSSEKSSIFSTAAVYHNPVGAVPTLITQFYFHESYNNKVFIAIHPQQTLTRKTRRKKVVFVTSREVTV